MSKAMRSARDVTGNVIRESSDMPHRPACAATPDAARRDAGGAMNQAMIPERRKPVVEDGASAADMDNFDGTRAKRTSTPATRPNHLCHAMRRCSQRHQGEAERELAQRGRGHVHPEGREVRRLEAHRELLDDEPRDGVEVEVHQARRRDEGGAREHREEEGPARQMGEEARTGPDVIEVEKRSVLRRTPANKPFREAVPHGGHAKRGSPDASARHRGHVLPASADLRGSGAPTRAVSSRPGESAGAEKTAASRSAPRQS